MSYPAEAGSASGTTLDEIYWVVRLFEGASQFCVLPKNGGKGRNGAVGPVAQVVEQLTFNQWVEGSNPSGLTIFLRSFSNYAIRNFLGAR